MKNLNTMKKLLLILLLVSCSEHEIIEEQVKEMNPFVSSLGQQETEHTAFSLPANGVYVYLLTGQSNALGAGLNSEALSTELDESTNMKIWSGTSFVNLNIGAGNNFSSTGKHGRELGMSLNLFDGEPLYMIKLGSSGTPINEHLSGGSVYTLFWDDVKNGINNLINGGYRPFVFLGFHQGEADGGATLAPLYADKLDTWVSLWRGNLGINLPISVTEIKESLATSYIINDAFHAKAASDILFNVISAKDLASYDGVHLTYESQKTVAAAELSLIASVVPVEITSLIP